LFSVLQKPKHPVVVVLGGIKLETKLPLIKELLPLVDKILLAGGLANTYLWAQGYAVGNSLIEKQFKKEMLSLAQNKKIGVPVDVVVGTKQGNRVQQVTVDELYATKNDLGIYDLGPKSIKVYTTYIREAQTIIWNGAVGFFEQTPYEKGTYALAKAIAQSSKKDAFAVCGGGETEEILRRLKILKHIDLVSTGGGAMLEYLSGKELPGLKILGVT
jgi:phosphoglycerate kinase